MRAEPVIESGRDRLQRSSVEGAPPPLRIAERPEQSRVQKLVALAQTLLREAEALASDKQFTDESNRIHALNISEGVDFYREIERFEINLIKLALDQTGGHQARAARLLQIRPTTLHSKIKLYGIEY